MRQVHGRARRAARAARRAAPPPRPDAAGDDDGRARPRRRAPPVHPVPPRARQSLDLEHRPRRILGVVADGAGRGRAELRARAADQRAVRRSGWHRGVLREHRGRRCAPHGLPSQRPGLAGAPPARGAAARALRDRRPRARRGGRASPHTRLITVYGPRRMERKKTPLWNAHRELGARLIDFGGWDMPVQYATGTIKEHRAVREAVGLFDVSHMGEVFLRGPRVRSVVDKLTTNAVAGAPAGKAVYTLLCLPSGGVVDDCIFYKYSDEEFLVIVNASNTAKDLEWFREHVGLDCDVVDVSDQKALIAVQGPKAIAMVDALAGGALSGLTSFTFADATIAGVSCIAARTGYTGEDGFELCCNNDDAERLWFALLDAARPLGGVPVGLGARDSLRLEARLPLYGNDLDEDHTPLEAGLGWAVKLDGREFLGAAALRQQKAEGLRRQLIGFTIADELRAIARHGYSVVDRGRERAGDGDEGAAIGRVTSGGPGIWVGGAIGLAYVPTAYAKPGQSIVIDCRGKDVPAT